MQAPEDGPLKVLGVVVIAAFLRDLSFFRSIKGLTIPCTIGVILYRALKTPEEEPLLTWMIKCLTTGQSTAATLLIKDLLGLIVLEFLIRLVRQARRMTWRETKASVGDGFFNLAKHLPPVQKQLQGEAEKLEQSLEHSLRPEGTVDPIKSLPAKGRSQSEIITQLKGFCVKEEPKWRDGYVSGAVYSGEASLLELMGQASALYSVSNPLHPDLWPSLMKFEAEICSMVANLVCGGTAGVVGSITSGGTESILLAAKTHRDWYRAEKGVTEPEIVACVSAHAAIDKACNLMGIRLVKIPMNPKTFELDIGAMERAITSNTIMLYSSAPTFPQGVIDPIPAVAKLGRKYGVGVHVDCCLGGFILPFAKKLGYSVPDFDFGLPGVTSMSVDTHKYGYASKGTSVVVYRSKEIRHYQYFCFPSWTGGLYVTPTVAGSRPGALSAACWAAMVHTGEDGYLKRAKEILETTRTIAEGVKAIPGLFLQGKAEAMIVCVGSDELNIYDVGDYMTKKGWSLNSLQDPAGLHLCCTYRTVGKAQVFLNDLKQAVTSVRESMAKDGGKKKTGNAAIYGMASSLPAGPIKMMLCTYTDVVLKA